MSDLSDHTDRSDVTTCARHPKTETRLSCAECGTPICPSCAIETPVGQKCPSCAKLPKTAVRLGTPDQMRNAILYGIGASVAGAGVLRLAYGSIGFLLLIITGAVGYYIGKAVLAGAKGNRADVFRTIAMIAAVVAALGGWALFGHGIGFVFRDFWTFATLLAAAYGAWSNFR